MNKGRSLPSTLILLNELLNGNRTVAELSHLFPEDSTMTRVYNNLDTLKKAGLATPVGIGERRTKRGIYPFLWGATVRR